jgi:hypothetical protein
MFGRDSGYTMPRRSAQGPDYLTDEAVVTMLRLFKTPSTATGTLPGWRPVEELQHRLGMMPA